MNKICTSLEQSKKLIELGIDVNTADMFWLTTDKPRLHVLVEDLEKYSRWDCMPAWSLAALLEVLDDTVVDDEGNEYSLTISKEEGMYYIYYHDRWGEVNDIETDCYYDLVDACYEMIIKLHEQNIL